jgi:hypothetical protein
MIRAGAKQGATTCPSAADQVSRPCTGCCFPRFYLLQMVPAERAAARPVHWFCRPLRQSAVIQST